MSSTPTVVSSRTPRRRHAPRTVPLTITRTPARGRVVVLGATVGQGHEGAARELARRLRSRGVDVAVHDYLDALPTPARRVLRDLYQPTVQYAPRLFDRIFWGLERDGSLRRIAAAICASAETTVAGWAEGADAVVTTYPFAGQTLGRLRDQDRLAAPSVTYLTDPAAHALWCHRSVDLHLTVTRATALDALRYGVHAHPVGPLCAPGFDALDDLSRAVTRHTTRAQLGLPHDVPVVLLSAGSLGMGSIPRTVREILAHPRAHAIVLCGRNADLEERLTATPRVVPLGWRDDVPALMAAADMLVHNAGGLSFTEALVAGLPAITYRPIPGHGRANADVLHRAGIAPWPRTPTQLVDTIDALGSSEQTTHIAPWPARADPADTVLGLLDDVAPPLASGL